MSTPPQQSHSRPQLARGESSSAVAGGGSMDDVLGADLVNNILSRLPAKSFAFAACVNHFWNSICSRILSVPKLSTAISLNPSLDGAVNEVMEKVMSEPIRPHFVIASVGPAFSVDRAHDLIKRRFGSSVPVVTSLSNGIIGRDAITNEFKEVEWEVVENDEDPEGDLLPNEGILITVGYLPGLKVTLVPMPSFDRDAKGKKAALLIDEFVMDIRKCAFTTPAMTPSTIILFSDLTTDMRPVLQKLEYVFPGDTVILGEGSRRHCYRSNWITRVHEHDPAIVALVFLKDGNKPPGIGEIQFHATLSTGLRPVGPVYRAVSVKENKKRSTWLTARSGAAYENLDGRTILDNIYNEIGDGVRPYGLYIGVKKKRKCSIWLDKVRTMMFLEFHEVIGGDEEYLYVNDWGIKTGDAFRFYMSDPNTALRSRNDVSECFRRLNHNFVDTPASTSAQQPTGTKTMSVFGGLIFACCGRGEQFFEQRNVDSIPFLENFPGVPIGGTFCFWEMAMVDKSIYGDEPQDEEDGGSCSHHYYSTVYLALSCTPA
ncbi:OLC1v1005992C2 [Oldenlandia corymbosa var. corymbosa]|nr:OLC1v1005992C2 [Oldenlandia corymbosa var. corymbosa]